MRATARRPELVDDVEVVRADLLTGSGIEEALDGVSTAYYLIHSMEAAANGDFAGRDRRMADTFAEAAARAGVERIVYLGGIVPASGAAAAPAPPRLLPSTCRPTSAPGSRSRPSSCPPSPPRPPSARPSSSARGHRVFAFSFDWWSGCGFSRYLGGGKIAPSRSTSAT